MRNWIGEKAAATLNPPQVENTLKGIADALPTEAEQLPELLQRFPLGESALLHLISVSSICASRLVLHPEILDWLSRPEICDAPRGIPAMLADLRRIAEGTTFAGNFHALRFWKGREMTRIALREVADAASLEETALELSQLAEICLREVYCAADAGGRKHRLQFSVSANWAAAS